jgi:hypothetical protein
MHPRAYGFSLGKKSRGLIALNFLLRGSVGGRQFLILVGKTPILPERSFLLSQSRSKVYQYISGVKMYQHILSQKWWWEVCGHWRYILSLRYIFVGGIFLVCC